MVAFVFITNILISSILIYVAIYLWEIKHKLGLIADRLTDYERFTQTLLDKAPENIHLGYENINNLETRKHCLKLQIQKIEQIISILGIGRKLGRYILGKLSWKSGKKARTEERTAKRR